MLIGRFFPQCCTTDVCIRTTALVHQSRHDKSFMLLHNHHGLGQFRVKAMPKPNRLLLQHLLGPLDHSHRHLLGHVPFCLGIGRPWRIKCSAFYPLCRTSVSLSSSHDGSLKGLDGVLVKGRNSFVTCNKTKINQSINQSISQSTTKQSINR